MANYKSTTRSYVVKDSYGSDWQQATLSVTCAANGTITWSVTMDNSGSKVGYSYTTVSLYLVINGTKVYDGYYKNSNGTKNKFPTNKGSSASGTLSSTASGRSFTVDMAVCCMQSATTTSNSGRLTNGVATRLKTGDAWGQTFSRDLATYTVTFNANGGNTPNPTSKTVTSGSTYGTLATCTKNTANNYSYSLKGWYTATSGGTQITSSSTVNISANQTLYAQWKSTLLTSACGTPTVTISPHPESYYFYVKATAGSNGTGNNVTGVELFITVDGTEPSATNYQYHKVASCSAGGSGYIHVYTDGWTNECIEWYNRSMTIKAKARTLGAAGSSFYSGLSSTASSSYYHYGKSTNGVTITNPSASGLVCGCSNSEYINITWEDEDLNVDEYYVYIYEADTGNLVDSYCTFDTYYSICTNVFTPGCNYYVAIDKYDNLNFNWINSTASKGLITVKAITPFSQPNVQVVPAGSFPAVKPDWRQDNSRLLYLNNGNGNICKLSWTRPYASNNLLSGYEVHIYIYDTYSGSTRIAALAEFVGDVNEYYVKSDLIKTAIDSFEQQGIATPKVFECEICVVPKSVYGQCYEPSSFSSQARFYVVNGSGIYTKVAGPTGESVVKRALPFLRDDKDNWHFVYDVSKHDGNNWAASDTWYEPITTTDNEPVMDYATNEILYSL